MAAKQKRPPWFKMFLRNKPMIEAFPAIIVGEAIKLALRYFDDRQVPEIDDPLTLALFNTLKPDIDAAWDDYLEAVRNGKDGANTRWGNQAPS